MKTTLRSPLLAAGALCLSATASFAHSVPTDSGSFLPGVIHPFSGLDHLLAMFAIGLWAAQLGGRNLWALPMAFVGAMLPGALLGLASTVPPTVEVLIGLSVLCLGLLIAGRVRMPVVAAFVMTASFGLLHGHAHGSELAAGGSVAAYFLGFTTSTIALHVAGILAGLGTLDRLSWTRATGGAIALCAVALLIA